MFNIKGHNNGVIIVNGKKIEYSGNNISICNGEVIVDGKVVTSEIGTNVKIVINGDVNNIDCGGSVEVHGNCGSVDCGGSCTVNGNVTGNIDAGGHVACGNVSGDIDAGGHVTCRR